MPQFPTVRKEKRGIVTSLISGFIGLAYEGSFLHNRRHKALHKAVKALETKANIQCKKLYVNVWGLHFGKLINTLHQIHNNTPLNERLFTGELNTVFIWYVNKQGVQHHAINLLLYLRILREKYVKMYEEFILQLSMYARAI